MATTRKKNNNWLYAVVPLSAACLIFVGALIGGTVSENNAQSTIKTQQYNINDLTQALGAAEEELTMWADSVAVLNKRLQDCEAKKKPCPCTKTATKPKSAAKPAQAKPKPKPKPDQKTVNTTVTTPKTTAAPAIAQAPAATQQDVSVNANTNNGIVVVGNGNAVTVTNVVQEAEKATQEKKYKCYVIDARIQRQR